MRAKHREQCRRVGGAQGRGVHSAGAAGARGRWELEGPVSLQKGPPPLTPRTIHSQTPTGQDTDRPQPLPSGLPACGGSSRDR